MGTNTVVGNKETLLLFQELKGALLLCRTKGGHYYSMGTLLQCEDSKGGTIPKDAQYFSEHYLYGSNFVAGMEY